MNAKHVLLAVVAVAMPWSSGAWAQPIFIGEPITANTTIDASRSYPEKSVGVFDDSSGSPTVQLVDGGSIGGWAQLFDESRLIMSGGEVGGKVVVLDDATFTMTGGVVGSARSPVIDGGDIYAEGTSTIQIRGGRFALDAFELFGESSLHFYGTNLESWVSGGGLFSVTGLLEDGEPINASGLMGPSASVFVHNVPEPAALSLAAVGVVTVLWRLSFPVCGEFLQRGRFS